MALPVQYIYKSVKELWFRSCSYFPRKVVWMTHYCFVRVIMGERPSVRNAFPSILAWGLTDSQLYITAVQVMVGGREDFFSASAETGIGLHSMSFPHQWPCEPFLLLYPLTVSLGCQNIKWTALQFPFCHHIRTVKVWWLWALNFKQEVQSNSSFLEGHGPGSLKGAE